MKKFIKAALFCAAAAGFIPYDLRKTDEGEVQSRSLFLEIRKREDADGETQVQVSFPMIDRLDDLGRKLVHQVKQVHEDIRTAGEEVADADFTPCEDGEVAEAAAEEVAEAVAEEMTAEAAEEAPCEDAFAQQPQPAEAL